MRANPSEARPPVKPRSTSRSTKLPVVVFTGSSAYPEVCGSPAIRGDATSSGLRPPTTPWAVREASIAASDTLTIPSPPAASKAEATAPTHVTSPELFEMNDARALVIPEASTEHHEHNDANESSADSSLPLPRDTFARVVAPGVLGGQPPLAQGHVLAGPRQVRGVRAQVRRPSRRHRTSRPRRRLRPRRDHWLMRLGQRYQPTPSTPTLPHPTPSSRSSTTSPTPP